MKKNAKKIAVIIPAYNEEKNIPFVLKDTKKYIPAKDIIVVNDGSKDKTAAVVKKEKVTLITYKKNGGKGHAARKGCDYAYKEKYDYMILMDADRQHDPKDIKRIIMALEKVDIVYTYRVGEGNQPFLLKFGNFGLSMISFLLFWKFIKDTQSGFRGIQRSAYQQVRWNANDYVMESEMIARSPRLKSKQLPIKKIYLDREKGTTVKTGLLIGYRMLRLFFSLRVLGGKK